MDTYNKTKQTWTSPPSQELWVVNAWSFIVFVDVFKFLCDKLLHDHPNEINWIRIHPKTIHDSIRCWVSNVIVLEPRLGLIWFLLTVPWPLQGMTIFLPWRLWIFITTMDQALPLSRIMQDRTRQELLRLFFSNGTSMSCLGLHQQQLDNGVSLKQ
jgi:hypothetical protein